jgi:hypothetical protein
MAALTKTVPVQPGARALFVPSLLLLITVPFETTLSQHAYDAGFAETLKRNRIVPENDPFLTGTLDEAMLLPSCPPAEVSMLHVTWNH